MYVIIYNRCGHKVRPFFSEDDLMKKYKFLVLVGGLSAILACAFLSGLKRPKPSEESLEKVVEESYWALDLSIQLISGNLFQEMEDGSIIFHLGGGQWVKLTHDQVERIHGITLLNQWRERIQDAQKKDPRLGYILMYRMRDEISLEMSKIGTPVSAEDLPPDLAKGEELRRTMIASSQR